MPAKHSRHIPLTGPVAEWVDTQVAKGESASVSDLIRTAIRGLQAQEEGRVELTPTSTIQPLATHERS